MQHFGLWRVLTWLIGLLGNRDRGRQHCNKERKDHFSHALFYRVVRTFPTDWTDNRSPRARFADADALRSDHTFAAVDKAKRRVHHGPRSHEPIEGSS